jgi:signal transduction histidine kinase
MFFGSWATLLWTAITSAAYCSFLIWALRVYELTPDGLTELAIRNLFFFLAAIVVNRFVTENRRQSSLYRQLAEQLTETNRRLEQAQEEARRSERLAALGQLSAGLAHELRNPLAVIKGSAETLARKLQSADPLATEVAGYISSEVNRLNAIVTRFLDFARPFKLELRSQQVPPLLDRALRGVHDRWPDAKIEVERQYADNLPAVPVDPDLCEQVFTNLVLNAYEAMNAGGGKLRVAVTAAQSDGRRGVEVRVEDTGPGIPAESRAQIFNPFFTTKKEGVGLGLSIVSKIVDDHRGWIRVRSEPGKGACFQVFLPGE